MIPTPRASLVPSARPGISPIGWNTWGEQHLRCSPLFFLTQETVITDEFVTTRIGMAEQVKYAGRTERYH